MYLKRRANHPDYLLGCSFILLVLLLGLVGLAALAIHYDQQAVRYPGAIMVSRHSHYQALPRLFLWVRKYQTADPLWTVYGWYEEELALLPISLVSDGCLYLRGSKRWSYVTRSTSVTLCETSIGQTITVTQLTSVW